MDLYPEGGQFIDQLKPRKPMIAFNRRFYLHTRTPPLQFEVVDGVTLGSLWVLLPDLGILIAGDTVSVDDVPCFDDMSRFQSLANNTGDIVAQTFYQMDCNWSGIGTCPAR